MSELSAVYIVCLRELIRYTRAKERIIGSLVFPVFIFVGLGFGLRTSVAVGSGSFGYSQFVAPGVIAMSLLFMSTMSGVGVLWDKEFGFMKEMLVAPISRLSIVAGKTIGSSITALLQGLIIIVLSFVFSNGISLDKLVLLVPTMLLISLGFVGLGILIASRLKTMEGFQPIMNFIVMPTFFLSGALFPINNLPFPMRILSFLDPLTYGVELLRSIMLGQSSIPPLVCLPVLLAFSASTLFLGAQSFSKMD